MKKNRAYSLLEVLVAFAILTAAMLPVLTLYPAIFKMSSRAGDNEELARLSLSVVDYIKSRGHDTLLSYDGTSTSNGSINIFASDGLSYTLEELDSGAYTSTDEDNDGDPDFESDFSIPDGFFLLNSKEGSLSGAAINISMGLKDFVLLDSDGNGIDYYNPVTGDGTANFDLSILTTTTDVVSTTYIAGTVEMIKDDRDYDTTFVVSPIENW